MEGCTCLEDCGVCCDDCFVNWCRRTKTEYTLEPEDLVASSGWSDDQEEEEPEADAGEPLTPVYEPQAREAERKIPATKRLKNPLGNSVSGRD